MYMASWEQQLNQHCIQFFNLKLEHPVYDANSVIVNPTYLFKSFFKKVS